MILNFYLIFLKFTRGITTKRKIPVGGAVLGRFHSRGESPRIVQLRGETLDENLPFPLM
jgi:hypothetical protein